MMVNPVFENVEEDYRQELASVMNDPKSMQRRGKWTAEEEAYSNRLVQEFKDGIIPLPENSTLRSFLAKFLNCDPMRISKKYVGSNSIGKQVYKRNLSALALVPPDHLATVRRELSQLEKRFLLKADSVRASAASRRDSEDGKYHRAFQQFEPAKCNSTLCYSPHLVLRF